MKAVCRRDTLLSACQLASVAVAQRDVKPVLRNLKAIVDDTTCTLMATDLELGIRLAVPDVRVEEPGEALLPTTHLISILRESGDDEMTIDVSPDAVSIRGLTNEFTLPGEDAAAFPDVPAFGEESYHEVNAGILREMIRRVIFSAASEGGVKFGATTGVLWELEDSTAALVATDGRRLAQARGEAASVGGHSTKGQMPVVPAKAMTLLERNLTEPDAKVRVSFRQNEVLIMTDRSMIYSRLVEGRFPNYKQVIPAKNSIRVPLTVGSLMSAVRQAAIMTDDESKRVTFQFTRTKLTLRAHGMKVGGQSRVEMPIELAGKDIDINFDPKFVIEMLRVLEPDTVLQLEMEDAARPALFRAEPNFLYVLVPLVAQGS